LSNLSTSVICWMSYGNWPVRANRHNPRQQFQEAVRVVLDVTKLNELLPGQFRGISIVIFTAWPGKRNPASGRKVISVFSLVVYQPITFLALLLSESVAVHAKWSLTEVQFIGLKLPGLRLTRAELMGGSVVGVGVRVGIGVGVGVGLDFTL